MTRYGKLTTEGQVEFAPNILRIKGGIVLNPQPKQLLEAGYLPVVDEVPDELPPEGKEWMPTGYVQEETRIVQGWELVDQPPPPEPEPRRFSVYELTRKLKAEGMWQGVEQWISKNDLIYEYCTCDYIEESNPLFTTGLAELKSAYQVTDEWVEALLSACLKKNDR